MLQSLKGASQRPDLLSILAGCLIQAAEGEALL